MVHVQASEASRVSIGSGGWRPSRVRSRSRAADPMSSFSCFTIQVVAFRPDADPGAAAGPRRGDRAGRAEPGPHPPRGWRLAASRGRPSSTADGRGAAAIGTRAASCARGGRGAVAWLCARRRSLSTRRLAAPRRGSAASARLLYLWDEGGGRKARAARGGRPARRVPLTFEAAAAAAAQSGPASWRACNQHRWARREGQHDEFRAGGKEGGDGGVAMRPAAQREHGWRVSRGRGDR